MWGVNRHKKISVLREELRFYRDYLRKQGLCDDRICGIRQQIQVLLDAVSWQEFLLEIEKKEIEMEGGAAETIKEQLEVAK
jgi:hypothetical protein